MLKAISPIDGRYAIKTKELQEYFSEFALIKYRLKVEVQYFLALCDWELPQLKDISPELLEKLKEIESQFSKAEANNVKAIEGVTNHDVKAVEYHLKEVFEKIGLSQKQEFIHFGLTSQDINNTAFPMMIRDSLDNVVIPYLQKVITKLEEKATEYRGIPMLARTHGQPASPTTVGKEFGVFIERLKVQLDGLSNSQIKAKFGGATGNFNAHKAAYPDIDWRQFGDKFVEDYLGLQRSKLTTQIAHYDSLSSVFDNLRRLNVILIDLCRDIWTYISMDYFGQKVVAGEVGSSAMPHKVNPIDFENAEGNLGIANAIFDHLSNKLPVSRLQRDLTDSTVLRNVGVPIAHSLIAYKSILKGISKIILREGILDADLDKNWAVVSEAIQNILRRDGYPKPYEALKKLTRGNTTITKDSIHAFIEELGVSDNLKSEMKSITPQNYVGYY